MWPKVKLSLRWIVTLLMATIFGLNHSGKKIAVWHQLFDFVQSTFLCIIYVFIFKVNRSCIYQRAILFCCVEYILKRWAQKSERNANGKKSWSNNFFFDSAIIVFYPTSQLVCIFLFRLLDVIEIRKSVQANLNKVVTAFLRAFRYCKEIF